jgi:hypothetical protein
MALTVALSRVPTSSIPATAAMIAIAGMLLRQIDDPAQFRSLHQRHRKPRPRLQQRRGIARPADRDRADHQ